MGANYAQNLSVGMLISTTLSGSFFQNSVKCHVQMFDGCPSRGFSPFSCILCMYRVLLRRLLEHIEHSNVSLRRISRFDEAVFGEF